MAITWLSTLKDEDLCGKTILCRVDFNVPLDEHGHILDHLRIDLTLPTIRRLVQARAKVVLVSHLGRPKGKPRSALSLEPVANYLRDVLAQEITFVHDCVGDGVAKIVGDQTNGSVTLLENVRFHPGEEKNDPVFAKLLARKMDLYVNDAFGAVHRPHASVDGVVKFFDRPIGGMLLENELSTLQEISRKPKEPFVAIIGGAKVSSKIGVLTKLLGKVNTLIVGGGMAHTLLKAKGEDVGASLVEDDKLVIAKSLLKHGRDSMVNILLPIDHIVCTNIARRENISCIKSNEFRADQLGVDIGPQTIAMFKEAIKNAATIFFNGPVGVSEVEEFSRGTKELLESVANSGAFSIVGGGDSIAALNKFGLLKKISFVSSGGGASLELIEGKKLPGLLALGFYNT